MEYVLEVRSNNGIAGFPSWHSPSSTRDFLTCGDLQQNMKLKFTKTVGKLELVYKLDVNNGM